MVPPIWSTSFCSSIKWITGCFVPGSNSTELALFSEHTLRANSATAICIPRQIPKNGTLCSRA